MFSLNDKLQRERERETLIFFLLLVCRRHNDLPWNIRKFLKNQLREFRFDDLRDTHPWSRSAWSHTDLRRLKEGMVAAQVSTTITAITRATVKTH